MLFSWEPPRTLVEFYSSPSTDLDYVPFRTIATENAEEVVEVEELKFIVGGWIFLWLCFSVPASHDK